MASGPRATVIVVHAVAAGAVGVVAAVAAKVAPTRRSALAMVLAVLATKPTARTARAATAYTGRTRPVTLRSTARRTTPATIMTIQLLRQHLPTLVRLTPVTTTDTTIANRCRRSSQRRKLQRQSLRLSEWRRPPLRPSCPLKPQYHRQCRFL